MEDTPKTDGFQKLLGQAKIEDAVARMLLIRNHRQAIRELKHIRRYGSPTGKRWAQMRLEQRARL